jgi:hypothetical protein
MKPDPIYLYPGTYALAGSLMERHIRDLESHVERLQALLGAELQTALAGIGDSLKNEPSALISFTGAFTGLSTLLHFCTFTRGIIALERGMETRADQDLVAKLRLLLVPVVNSQCEVLAGSMSAHQDVRADSLMLWYSNALAEVQTIKGFIGRVGN